MLMRSPLARGRRSPPGFIRPCLLTPTTVVPTGPQWLHELKHDGMRVILRKVGSRVSIWSRNGRPWTTELVAIAAALRELDSEDLVLDGEAVAHCREGLPNFHRLLGEGKPTACLYAFDLLEIPARICGRCRSRPARRGSPASSRARLRPSATPSTWTAPTGLPCSPTPAA